MPQPAKAFFRALREYHEGLSGIEKSVLIHLGLHADAHGLAWPGLERLTEETCFSRASVRRALARLEELGMIHREGWKGHTRLYRLDLAHLGLAEQDPAGAHAPESARSQDCAYAGTAEADMSLISGSDMPAWTEDHRFWLSMSMQQFINYCRYHGVTQGVRTLYLDALKEGREQGWV